MRRRAAIHLAADRVVLRTQLRGTHVAHAHDRGVALVAGTDDNILEFFRLDQHALAGHGKILPGPFRCGRLPDLADAEGLVLSLDGIGDFRNADSHLRHPVGFQPHPHCNVRDRKHRRQVGAGDAFYRIEHIEIYIVIEVDRGHRSFWRVETDDHHEGLGFLLGRNALVTDDLGQLRQCLADAVLGIDLCNIRIRPWLECNDESHVTGRGTGRGHVDHVIDTVDLLLDRRGNGVGDDLGRRTGVARRNGNGWRRHIGVLRDWRDAKR